MGFKLKMPGKSGKPASRKSFVQKLVNLRIGQRTAVGFIVVLTLTTLVSIVGWNALGDFHQGVEVANETNRLDKLLLETRVREKDFAQSKRRQDADAVVAGIGRIRGEAESLKEQLDSSTERQRIDAVAAAVGDYETAFLRYVELEETKNTALAKMLTEAQALQQMAAEIETDQKQGFLALKTEVEDLQAQSKVKLATADDANQLIEWTAEIRKNEKDFLLRDDLALTAAVEQQVAEILALAKDLKARFESPVDQMQADDMADAAELYYQAFSNLVDVAEFRREAAALREEIVVTLVDQAQKIEDIANSLRQDQMAQYKTMRADGTSAAAALDAKLTMAEYATRLSSLFDKARQDEKNYLLTRDEKYAQNVEAYTNRVGRLAKNLAKKLTKPANIDLAKQVEAITASYGESFVELMTFVQADIDYRGEQDEATKVMVEQAEKLEGIAAGIRRDQKSQYQALAGRVQLALDNMLDKQEKAESASRLIASTAEVRQQEKNFLFTGDEESAGGVRGVGKRIVDFAVDLEERFFSREDKEKAVQMADKAREYLTRFEDVVAVTADQKAASATMIGAADAVNDIVAEAGSHQETAMQDQKQRSDAVVLGGTAGALTLGALLAFLIGRGISRPINLMTRAMRRLADGDLEVEVPARGRGDEIGEMATTVQVFKENAVEKVRLESEQEEKERKAEEEKRQTLRQMADQFETSVGVVVEQVSSAATEMQASSESMSATAEETTKQSGAVASASEQASANVQTVASAAEELSSSISEISRQVSQASEIASGAVREAEQTNAKIQGLAEAANKIGEVVALITDIADQTNLLALNATIEAARAGDAGKGFAVVASEVKNLANQTAKATDEIGTQIAGIQTATQDAVQAIESITKTISDIHEVNSGIASAVEQQGAATQEIARNVEQAAAGTQEVNSNITGVSRAANDTGAAATEIRSAAGELSQQSERLRAEVDRFLNSVRSA